MIRPTAPNSPPILATPEAKRLDGLKQAAKGFEAIFMRQMIGAMRAAKLADDDLTGSDAGDQFRDMQDSRLADSMTADGSMGIAQLLLRQFGGDQAAADAARAAAPAKADTAKASAPPAVGRHG